MQDNARRNVLCFVCNNRFLRKSSRDLIKRVQTKEVVWRKALFLILLREFTQPPVNGYCTTSAAFSELTQVLFWILDKSYSPVQLLQSYSLNLKNKIIITSLMTRFVVLNCLITIVLVFIRHEIVCSGSLWNFTMSSVLGL